MTKWDISTEVPDRVSVIGAPVSVVNMESALDFVHKNLDTLRGKYICASNAHTSVMAYEDAAYKKVQSDAMLNLPDGKPLAVIGKKKTSHPMEKTTGTHFMQHIFSDERFAGKKHYFYGTREEDLVKMIPQLRQDYPQLQICGWEPSVFRELNDGEAEALACRVNKAEADFLWIALGAPRQEWLMHRLQDKVHCLMTGVGGAFHILAGSVADAPEWMQHAGLEWFFRLWKEPRRLFRRYLITNTKFILYALKDNGHV